MDEQDETDAATRLLDQMRDFAKGLADDERELFAVLVGPGMQQLTEPDDVTGFGADGVRWEAGSLRDRLSHAVQESEWQIVDGPGSGH